MITYLKYFSVSPKARPCQLIFCAKKLQAHLKIISFQFLVGITENYLVLNHLILSTDFMKFYCWAKLAKLIKRCVGMMVLILSWLESHTGNVLLSPWQHPRMESYNLHVRSVLLSNFIDKICWNINIFILFIFRCLISLCACLWQGWQLRML